MATLFHGATVSAQSPDGDLKSAANRDLEETRRIVLAGLKGMRAQVYLYGSRAKGVSGRFSDIDVAILPEQPLPVDTLPAIREALEEESRVLYRVDLVDLSQADEEFRQKVIREGILWTG